MTEKIISSKAKWNLQELIPVIIMLGIGLFALYMYISGTWLIEMSIIIGLFGFGLFAWLTYLNLHRKWKSTLFAELGENDKFDLSVWMRKPLKTKWNGKIDEGKNKIPLTETRFVFMESILSTRVIVFNYAKGKNFYLPVRFVKENEELRLYLVDAVVAMDGKLKFKNKTDKTEFEAILLGEGKAYGTDKSGIDPATATVEGEKKVQKKTVKTEETKPVEKAVVADVEEDNDAIFKDDVIEQIEETPEPEQKEFTIAPAPVVATQVIGYGKYEKKDTVGQIDDVMNKLSQKMDEDAREKEEAGIPLPKDLFNSGDNSITIDLGNNDKK